MTTQRNDGPMQPAVEQAAALCGNIGDIAQEAIAWLDNDVNRNLVGQRHEALARQMRQSARQAERLRNAATSPVSIAVYGASQSGKSFLVAHLAAPPSGGSAGFERSAAVLPHARDAGIPFLEINPTGGRESTGLVTRFTTRPIVGDRKYPVLVRLLSVLDIIKILASCYFTDMEQSEEGPLELEKIEKLLTEVKVGRSTPTLGLSGDDVYELKDYCQRWQHLRNNVKVLNAAQYWERVADQAERIDINALAKLLEVLWGGIAAFTAIFRKLLVGLEQLGFSGEVQCGLDALLPRVDPRDRDKPLTIIDVDTLKRLLGAAAEPLQVRHTSGVATLDRPVITALAAELVLNIHGETRPFLKRLDLLDFPGARTRGDTKRGKLEEEGEPESLFLRGKVAHLFERYRDEYDLTSMILCVGPSVQEVRTMPRLVNEWVEATHGDTPDKRRDADTSLFLVLTQFDRQFVRQTGSDADAELSDRWINRINATVADFLARDGNWTRDWHPGHAFKNLFWYRNPFVDQRHLFDYEEGAGQKRETALRRDMSEYVTKMHAHYHKVDLIRRHFADPEKAWLEVMTPNDGGISYLADAIASISTKNVKVVQIRARALNMARNMRAELVQYFYDDDPNNQLNARKAKARNLLREIDECYRRGLFGYLLTRLQLEQEELAQIFRSARLLGGKDRDVESPIQLGSRASDQGSLIEEAFGGGTQSKSVRVLDCSDIDIRRAELEERFACRAVLRWVERIDATCQNQHLLTHLGLTHDGAQTLASEMVAGIRRRNIAGNLADYIRDYVKYRDLEYWSAALVAATIINGFVNGAGLNGVHGATGLGSNGQPRAGGWGGAEPLADDRDHPVLGPESENYDREFCVTWIRAFDAFVGQNADSPEGRNFNAEQNAALGNILKQIGMHA
jgi:hypothetical protein